MDEYENRDKNGYTMMMTKIIEPISRKKTEEDLYVDMLKSQNEDTIINDIWKSSKHEFLSIIHDAYTNMKKSDINVLNVGCGRDTFFLERDFKGIYIDADMIMNPLIEIHNLEGKSVCCDVRYLPFRSDSFDIVFCIDLIHHFVTESINEPLMEMLRVTKKRGLLIIEEPNKFSLGRLPVAWMPHKLIVKLRRFWESVTSVTIPADYEAPLDFTEIVDVLKDDVINIKRIESFYYPIDGPFAYIWNVLGKNRLISRYLGYHWILMCYKS